MPLAIVMSLLTACAGVNSNPACVCPPVKEYSKSFQRKLAEEVEKAQINSAYPTALLDYQLLREQLRSCQ
jgi:hypothetical protein